MNITVVGGGNIGTQFAVHCAEKGHKVVIFTSKPQKFKSELAIVDKQGCIIHKGKIQLATSDAKIAFSEANVVFITMPAYCMEDLAAKITPHIKPTAYIGIIPGIGGGECAFKDCIDKGCTVFGLQRVPSVARLVVYGQKVCATGYRKELFLAAIPRKNADICAQMVEELFDMPCTFMPNYLNITLTPSNPILHTTRLYSLFKEYKEGKEYDYVPLFYEEWDDNSSYWLLKCDDEVQGLCCKLKDFDLSYIRSLREHYESNTVEEMTRKLCSIDSLKGLPSPTVQVGDKMIPDFSSRYFTADFPFGLAILKQIADLVDMEVPYMNQVLNWYDGMVSDQNRFDYCKYGIESFEDFKEFYSK